MRVCVCAEDRPSAPGSVLLRWWRAESGGHRAGQPRRQEGPSEMHAASQPVPVLSGQCGKNCYTQNDHLPVFFTWLKLQFVQLDDHRYFIHLLLIMDENSLLNGVSFPPTMLSIKRSLFNVFSAEVIQRKIQTFSVCVTIVKVGESISFHSSFPLSF